MYSLLKSIPLNFQDLSSATIMENVLFNMLLIVISVVLVICLIFSILQNSFDVKRILDKKICNVNITNKSLEDLNRELLMQKFQYGAFTTSILPF